ncbi:hypothetical protein ABKV19_004124 [Rosa sericea]
MASSFQNQRRLLFYCHRTELVFKIFMNFLKPRCDSIISPGAKLCLIPLAGPLSKNSSGAVTA